MRSFAILSVDKSIVLFILFELTMDTEINNAKIILILIDGLGDASLSQLEDRTPLQYAYTPHMDNLAASGQCGLLDPVSPGIACGSDTSHLEIMGYPSTQFYFGRGPLECIGSGLELDPGDIGFKCVFSTMKRDGVTVQRRKCDRFFQDWGQELVEALNHAFSDFEMAQVSFKYVKEHRCVVRVRADDLSDAISGTDPLTDGSLLLQCHPLNDSDNALYTSKVINAISERIRKVLQTHPITLERKANGLTYADVLLLRGAGTQGNIPSFHSRHDMTGICITATPIIGGLMYSLGLKVITPENATGDYRTDLMAKSRALLDSVDGNEFDFLFLHVKPVDEAGHDRDPFLKVKWIERTDAMVGSVVNGLESRCEGGRRFVVCVTGDHSTLCSTGDHSCDPVPLLLGCVGGGIDADTVTSFDEVSCASGILGRFKGNCVMPLLKKIRETCIVHSS